MEATKFGKTIKSMEEIKDRNLIVNPFNNNVFSVIGDYSEGDDGVHAKNFNEVGTIFGYYLLRETVVDKFRFATEEEYNKFLSDMKKLDIEYTDDFNGIIGRDERENKS